MSDPRHIGSRCPGAIAIRLRAVSAAERRDEEIDLHIRAGLTGQLTRAAAARGTRGAKRAAAVVAAGAAAPAAKRAGGGKEASAASAEPSGPELVVYKAHRMRKVQCYSSNLGHDDYSDDDRTEDSGSDRRDQS